MIEAHGITLRRLQASIGKGFLGGIITATHDQLQRLLNNIALTRHHMPPCSPRATFNAPETELLPPVDLCGLLDW